MVPTLVLVAVIIVAAAWYVLSRRHRPASPEEVWLPDGVSLEPREIFTKEEAAFYNVLRLAVQEQYLVFTKVPVSRLLMVQADDPEDESLATRLLRRLAMTFVDFVLVHPGTLTVAKVIELDGLPERGRLASIRTRLAHEALTTAGVDIVRIDLHQPFTIPRLAALLELEGRE